MHARSLPVLFALLAAPVLRAQDSPRPQQHLLRLAFQVGKQQYYRHTVSLQMHIDMGRGGKVDNSMLMQLTLSATVKAVKDGKADLDYTVHRVVAKGEGMNDFDYDSERADSDPRPVEPMANLIGRVVHVRLDDRGNVSDVVMPDGRRESAGLEMLGPFGANLMFHQLLPSLPDQPLAIGTTWQQTQQLDSPEAPGAKRKVTHRLAAVAAAKATLAQEFDLDLGGMPILGGGKLQFDKAAGALVLDLATGMPISMRSETLAKTDTPVVKADYHQQVELTAIDPPASKPAADGSAKPQHFTCSMHPQLDVAEPGLCPICRMQLEPKPPATGR